jgi:hypothetical protein
MQRRTRIPDDKENLNDYTVKVTVAVPQLSVTEFPPRKPGINPRLVHIGFVAGKVALSQGFLQAFRFSSANYR